MKKSQQQEKLRKYVDSQVAVMMEADVGLCVTHEAFVTSFVDSNTKPTHFPQSFVSTVDESNSINDAYVLITLWIWPKFKSKINEEYDINPWPNRIMDLWSYISYGPLGYMP